MLKVLTIAVLAAGVNAVGVQYPYCGYTPTAESNIPTSCSGVELLCIGSDEQMASIASLTPVSPCSYKYVTCTAGGVFAQPQPVALGTACYNNLYIGADDAVCGQCDPASSTNTATSTLSASVSLTTTSTATGTATSTSSGTSTKTQTSSSTSTKTLTATQTSTGTSTSTQSLTSTSTQTSSSTSTMTMTSTMTQTSTLTGTSSSSGSSTATSTLTSTSSSSGSSSATSSSTSTASLTSTQTQTGTSTSTETQTSTSTSSSSSTSTETQTSSSTSTSSVTATSTSSYLCDAQVNPLTSIPAVPPTCSGVSLVCARSPAQQAALASWQCISPCADGFKQCNAGGVYDVFQPVAGGTLCYNNAIISATSPICRFTPGVAASSAATASSTTTATKTATATATAAVPSASSAPTQTGTSTSTGTSTATFVPPISCAGIADATICGNPVVGACSNTYTRCLNGQSIASFAAASGTLCLNSVAVVQTDSACVPPSSFVVTTTRDVDPSTLAASISANNQNTPVTCAKTTLNNYICTASSPSAASAIVTTLSNPVVMSTVAGGAVSGVSSGAAANVASAGVAASGTAPGVIAGSVIGSVVGAAVVVAAAAFMLQRRPSSKPNAAAAVAAPSSAAGTSSLSKDADSSAAPIDSAVIEVQA